MIVDDLPLKISSQIYAHMLSGNIEAIAMLLTTGTNVDIRDQDGYTMLMRGVGDVNISLEVVEFLITHGADTNAVGSDCEEVVLGLSASSGDIDKVRLLLNNGANVSYKTVSGYDVLIHAAYGQHQNIALFELLIDRGAPLNGVTTFQESALSVNSRKVKFDIVRFLLAKGSDPARLQWTTLMKAIALGTLADVQKELLVYPNLVVRDRWERTPWLLSIHTGDLQKVELLWSMAIDSTDRAYCGKTVLMLAIESGNLLLLQWLISKGFDIEEVDDFDVTALRLAIDFDEVDSVAILLKAGADPKNVRENDSSNISNANSIAMVRMLVDAGEDFSGISRSMRRLLTKVTGDITQVSSAQYQAGKHRHFGMTNPELMEVAFWRSMVCYGVSAWAAKCNFQTDHDQLGHEPVWSYSRFGQSITELPDGRIIEIAGEHEDSYDPDFCIYNDVVVYDGRGDFQIYGYPKELFPPTDFHTATLVGDYIYIIGNLGYYPERLYGTTPLYRLDCRSYQIEKIVTTGNNPGWIYRHQAKYQAPDMILISGGVIENAPASSKNSLEYLLNLRTLIWQ